MTTQDTLFTNMMKRLNLSCDEPVCSERNTASSPAVQSVNVNVPLPGQTTLDSEDEVGNENHGFGDDSVSHTVLNNVLKSADIKRKEENYSRPAKTLENGLLSSGQLHGSGKCVCVNSGIQVTYASVGIQTSNSDIHPTMSDKSVQVAMPMFLGTDSQVCQSNSSGDNNSNLLLNCRKQGNMTKLHETTFSNGTIQKVDRPGTPVTKVISTKNHKSEKVAGHCRIRTSNHSSNKHTASIKKSSRCKSKKNIGETNEAMTVLDIADENL